MRPLRNILLSAPLLICVVGWIVSLANPAIIDREKPGHRTYVAVGDGGLYVGRYFARAYQDLGWTLRHWPSNELRDHEVTFRRYSWNYGFGERRGGRALTGNGDFGYSVLRIPFWALTVLFAVPPAVVVRRATSRRIRAARRVACGLCPACGYDLRTTPQHCPECGYVAG